MRKKKSIDLSDVFCAEVSAGQKRHGEYPKDVWRHFAACLAWKAGIGPDPGFYAGPVPDPPEEEMTWRQP
jgi:hypothetical protein